MNTSTKAAKCFRILLAMIFAMSLTSWTTALSAYADDETPESAASTAQDGGSSVADDTATPGTQPGANADGGSESADVTNAAPSDSSAADDSGASSSDADNAAKDQAPAANADTSNNSDAAKDDAAAAAAAEKAKKAPRAGDTPVCKIGNTAYDSIAEAVAAVPDGTPTTITMIADATMDAQVDIPAGKVITLTDDGSARRIDGTAGMFNVSGDFTIAATANDKLQLYGGDGESGFGNIATVGKNGTGHLTLSAGTLHGGTVDNPSNGAVYMKDGSFDMTGGVITDCDAIASMYYNAPVYVSGNAVFNMSGGQISGNESITSAGVMVCDFDKTKTPTFNLSGGKICDCKGGSGTAINAMSNARINISGGEISGNNGAYSSACIVNVAGVSELTMTGGKIVNNTSVYGGAVMDSSTGQCTFTAGEISGNVAGVAGGAIFGTKTGTKIHVENCLVEGNKATTMGGGLWCCPTGGADIYATHGIAIFDNTAEGAGDDFASLYDDEDADEKSAIHLSDYVLGDNRVDYFKDGAVQPDATKADAGTAWQGIAIADEPRYDATNPGDPVVVDGKQAENQALKSVVSETGKANARNQAKMIITNNTAAYGGGIATNGIVTAGFTDEDLDKEHEITISKQDGAAASIEGATLTVTDEFDVKVDEWTTDATGNHVLNLLPGTYSLSETKAPEGYKAAEPITFTVDRTGGITINGEASDTVVMVDEKEETEEPTFDVAISKANSNGDALKGAKLKVTGDGFEETWISDGTARTLKLQPGTYTFHEEAAPKGYLTVDDFKFTVTADGSVKLEGASDTQAKLANGTLTVTDQAEEPAKPEGEDPKTPGEENPGGSEEVTPKTSSNPKLSKATGSGSATTKASTLSKTGDGITSLPFALLAIAGAAGGLVAWKRRKTN